MDLDWLKSEGKAFIHAGGQLITDATHDKAAGEQSEQYGGRILNRLVEDVRPEGTSGHDIYMWFHNGRGVSHTIGPKQQGWIQVGNEYDEVKRHIEDALRASHAIWEGQAADSMHQQVSPLAAFADSAKATAHGTAAVVGTQSTDFANAKNKLEPMPSSRPLDNLLNGFAPVQTDLDKQISDYNNKSSMNQHVYQTYGEQTRANIASLPQWNPPPTVHGVVPTEQQLVQNNPEQPLAPTHPVSTQPNHGQLPSSVTPGPTTPGQDWQPQRPASVDPGGNHPPPHQPVAANMPQSADTPFASNTPFATNAAGYSPPQSSVGGWPSQSGYGGFGTSDGQHGAGAGGGYLGAGYGPVRPGSGSGGSHLGTGSLPGGGRYGAGALPEQNVVGGRGGSAGGAAGRPGAAGGPGMSPMGAGRGRGEEDSEHHTPSYLVEPDPEGLFGTDEPTMPPVIGE